METLEQLLKEVEKLKTAHDLLQEWWIRHSGPYDQSLPDDLRERMNAFFEFDDSE